MRQQILIVITSLCFLLSSAVASELTDIYKRISPSVVKLEVKDNFGNIVTIGTGFYVGDGCNIATNYHVIKGGMQVAVVSGGEFYQEKLKRIKVNKNYDIAIISVSKCGKALKLSGSMPEIGKEIFTVGNPRGLDKSLSNGVISGIREGEYSVIQTTAAISPGSSGGPLVDMSGAVVGMTTFFLKASQSLNFAVPSSALMEVLSSSDYFQDHERVQDIRQNALEVASSFFWAIHKKDMESALSFVEPSEQSEFEKSFNEFPEISETAELVIEQGAPIGANEHAEVSIKGTDIGIDLVKYRNGWWVVK